MSDDQVPPPASSPVPVLPRGVGKKTDPAMVIANPDYVKRKSGEAAWKAGWVAGIGSCAVIVATAFGIWFKSEASAQEKADKAKTEAIAAADAGTDRKLAPLSTEIAVLNTKVEKLSDDVEKLNRAADKSAEQQAEMLRLLRKRIEDGR